MKVFYDYKHEISKTNKQKQTKTKYFHANLISNGGTYNPTSLGVRIDLFLGHHPLATASSSNGKEKVCRMGVANCTNLLSGL